MSREPSRKGYYDRDPRDPRDRERRDRDRRDRDRDSYRSYDKRPMKRSPDSDDLRRGSPRKTDAKDVIDDNILSEISKLPEPSELWDSQFQDSGFPPPLNAPQFAEQMRANNPVYASSYQPTYSGLYDDFPPVASMQGAPQPPEWNPVPVPVVPAPHAPVAPAPPPAAPFIPNMEDQIKKEAAIELEMRHQKAALSKQREDYMKKVGILKKELETLKDQRNELRGDTKRSPSPDTKRFLKENTKLQLEIQNKLKTISNVVDMLNGIIGEGAKEVSPEPDDSPDRSSKRRSRSPATKNSKFNYVYYDPEMHWCRVCNDFPSTAKDYLNHLHSPAHHKMAAAHLEAPWHTIPGANEGFPNFPSAPTKRTPIRGLQFFVPSTAWYCKLCDQFIGDLHCASAHLKSVTHSKNYTNFVEQNPHWETDWMSDRQKALEKSRSKVKVVEEKPPTPTPPPPPPQPTTTATQPNQYTAHTITFNKDGFHTKKKEPGSPGGSPEKEKKKKKEKKRSKSKRKRSSSSSSASSSSSSDSEPTTKKKKKKDKPKEDDDKVLKEWMTSINSDRLSEKERQLLDSLKNRMKNKRDRDRRTPERVTKERERNIADMQRKIRESERGSGESRPEGRVRERRRDTPDRADRPDRPDRADRQRDAKPPKKMPFIGKMPVYKSLSKPKTEDQKKEDEKKKEEEEANDKRRKEIDAEIQKKVAEFKEKIARAQLEREQATRAPELLPPPSLLGPPPALAPPALAPPALAVPPPQPPPPAVTPMPTLPKDFQEALDIIFPSDAKSAERQQELFASLPLAGFPLGMGFPPMGGMMPPSMPHPQMMMNPFDMSNGMFPAPNLYDTHVPLMPNKQRQQNKPRPQFNNKQGPPMKYQNRPNQNQRNNNSNKNNSMGNKNKMPMKSNVAKNNSNENQSSKSSTSSNDSKESPKPNPSSLARQGGQGKHEKGEEERKKIKEEMDDFAMLGIDASDVGSGM